MATCRTILTLALPLALCSCAIPPAFMVTTSAGDNAAYAETGKSMADYALSHVVGRDCTLMYGFSRGKFCRDNAATAPEQSAESSAGEDAYEQEEEPPENPIFAMADQTAAPLDNQQPDSVPAAKAARPAPNEMWVLVLGVFSDYGQAAKVAAGLKPRPAVVASVIVRGEVFYRVTTRPFELDQAAEHEKQVSAVGLPDAKMVKVCPRWMQNESCLVVDRHFSM